MPPRKETSEALTPPQAFRRSFQSAPHDFIFACGGSIPIETLSQEGTSAPKQRLSSPIVLRWDPSDPSTPASQCRVAFPLENGEQKTFEGLLRDMHPATFGLGSEDVLDESYRKASKLDTSRFSSTFNPYEMGIIDAVGQLLLPNLQVGKEKVSLQRGVRAELYKLNVYSGPSGLFRAHVDTPRAADQFGSLVVCLPVTHTGGELKVQHLGRDVVFDWGTSEESAKKGPAIQWAAFYSNCLHEVLEVKSGHRVTLTYNLYATYGGGAITGLTKAIDMTSSPIYENLRDLLRLKETLPNGGYMGFYTTHSYPHSSDNSCLPHTLKGVDVRILEIDLPRFEYRMAIWEILGSLGCSMELQPIVKYGDSIYGSSSEEDDSEIEEWDGEIEESDGEIEESDDEIEESDDEIEESDNEIEESDDKIEESDDKIAASDDKIAASDGKIIGGSLEIDVLGSVEFGTSLKRMLRRWARKDKGTIIWPRDVYWLNESPKQNREPQITYTAYGNDAQAAVIYSACIILARVPERVEASGCSRLLQHPDEIETNELT
ncbi:hypothetical protein F4680DRAFT_448423 [Xylaria scruposa]|nr:hypothetical protein F4680DRAFT_448423 [Xylaria scruposa]